MDAADQLTKNGYLVYALQPDMLLVKSGDAQLQVRVVHQAHPPTAAQLRKVAQEASGPITLFVAPTCSRRSVSEITKTPGVGLLTQEGLQVFPGFSLPVPSEARRARGRTPWGRYALMRMILHPSSGRTQADLARQTGQTQAAVSQMLAKLDPLVKRTNDGWKAVDPEELCDAFLSEYPGPGGLRTYWYSMRPFSEQSEILSRNALLSADGAADVIAPWRIPEGIIAYSGSAVNWSQHFSPATRDESNIQLVMCEDRTIAHTSDSWGCKVVDPLIAMWDLRYLGGNNTEEAVDQIKKRVIEECWK